MKNLGERFECYSPRLRGWFMTKGIRYERSFKHSETGRTAYVYIMTEELSQALQEWKERK